MKALNFKKLVCLIGVFAMFVSLPPCQAFASSTNGIYLSVEAEPTVTGYSPVLVTVKLHNPTDGNFTVGSSVSTDEIARANVNHDGVVNANDIATLDSLLKDLLIGDVNHDGRFDANDLNLLYAAASGGIDLNGDGLIDALDVQIARQILDKLKLLIAKGDVNKDSWFDLNDVAYVQMIIVRILNSQMTVGLILYNNTKYVLYPKNGLSLKAHSDSLVTVTQIPSTAGVHQVQAGLEGAVLRDSAGKVAGAMPTPLHSIHSESTEVLLHRHQEEVLEPALLLCSKSFQFKKLTHRPAVGANATSAAGFFRTQGGS